VEFIGKVVKDNSYEIHCEDILKFKKLNKKSIGVIITSPPYFQLKDYKTGNLQLGKEKDISDYFKKMVNTFVHLKPYLTDKAKVWVNLGDTMIDAVYCNVPENFMFQMIEKGFFLSDKIIWSKKNPTPSGGTATNQAYEMIYCFTLSKNQSFFRTRSLKDIKVRLEEVSFNNGARLKSSWELSESSIKTTINEWSKLKKDCEMRGIKFEHQAGFPLVIPQLLLAVSAELGDLVLDPYSGTSSTGEAAMMMNMGLKYIGVEISQNFVDIANVRMEKHKSVGDKLKTLTESSRQDYISPFGDFLNDNGEFTQSEIEWFF
jgi:site-specific DNA-methyltransferase (adenine-specific)